MYYIIEKIFIKSYTNPIRWNDSKRVVCIKPELWQVKRYFKKIWTRYKETHVFDEFCVEDRCVEFYISDSVSIRFYITNDLYESSD